jgi:hypothetical protein
MTRLNPSSFGANLWRARRSQALILVLAGAVCTSACSSDDDDGGSPATGTLQVISNNPTFLQFPTTAALRGQNVWFTNGQLTGLFGGAAPTLPFQARVVPLGGGVPSADAIALSEATFYPEGIAAAADGTLYIGSIGLGTIVRVAPNSTTAEPFMAGTVSERGVIGITVDSTRNNMVWFCDSSPTAMPAAGAVVGVNSSGAEVVRHDLTVAGAAGIFCNDVRVNTNGDIFATESAYGAVFRIPAANAMTADSAQIWLDKGGAEAATAGGFGANGLAFVGNQLIVANSDRGNLIALDPTSDRPSARPISLTLNGAALSPLCGPDGLLAIPGTNDLVVVENGNCGQTNPAPRVSRVTLAF